MYHAISLAFTSRGSGAWYNPSANIPVYPRAGHGVAGLGISYHSDLAITIASTAATITIIARIRRRTLLSILPIEARPPGHRRGFLYANEHVMETLLPASAIHPPEWEFRGSREETGA